MAVFTGTDDPEVLTGGPEDDTITGLGGDDTLIGAAGADIMDGGAGIDTADYSASPGSVNISLATGLGRENDAELDQLSNIENLIGSAFNDILAGNSASNVLNGGAGNDGLSAGSGSDGDTLIGGEGNDLLSGYWGATVSMQGGAGDDDYYVFSLSDVVTENAGEGVDQIYVRNIFDYTLPDNVENLDVGPTGSSTATGNELNNLITGGSGGSGNNTFYGLGGDDLLESKAGNDTLYGGDGADTLDGGTGHDSMVGGLGDDYYLVENLTDATVEASGEGTDTVETRISITLAPNIEILKAASNLHVPINLTGNALNNTIIGTDMTNIIDGGAGADTMTGGDGNDTYFVDDVGDVIVEDGQPSSDTVFSTISISLLMANVENLTLQGTAIIATGNYLNNVITGNAQNNTLNGGAGEDTLAGGFGNDFYVVNSAGDVVNENAGSGFDTILSYLDVAALTAEVENVTLAGSALSAVGNTLNNIITGNSLNNTLTGGDGNDQLNGGVGADTLIGGLNDDTYLVENTGDVVTENSGEGNDVVYTSISIASLFDNVERVTITGAGNLDATGNGLDNRIYGNDQNNALTGLGGADVIGGLGGNDTITGGAGLDNLTGGAGNDTFVYADVGDSGVTGPTRDLINDFTQGQDLIDLSAIDANPSGGDDAFSFIGTSAFSSTAGELRYDQVNDPVTTLPYTVISMDVNGDGVADSQITLSTWINLTSADFVL